MVSSYFLVDISCVVLKDLHEFSLITWVYWTPFSKLDSG